jgi:peptidoglycan/xylan/chitin deacetylase (PgdA/CDA1 family)
VTSSRDAAKSSTRPRRIGPMAWLSPAGASARLFVFIFHRVLEREDPLRPGEPDVERFDRIVGFIARNFRVMALPEAAARLASGQAPAAAACITFDDGYADNLTLAVPILAKHGVTATVFVSTGYSDGERMWNDNVIEAVRALPAGDVDWNDLGLGVARLDGDDARRELIGRTLSTLKYRDPAERRDLASELARRATVPASAPPMMTREQLRAWRALGLDVGGHTVRHPILACLSDADAAREIGEGREQLTEWLGEAPRAFAYPNGAPGRDFGERDVALVRKAGFECAVTTRWGTAARTTDPYQLPRFTPWDRSMWRFGLRCASTLVEGRREATQPNEKLVEEAR